MRHVERSSDRREVMACLFGGLTVALSGRHDAERAEQIGRRLPGITRLAEHRVQSLGGEMVEHQINDAPRVKGLWQAGLGSGIHAPQPTSPHAIARSHLETVLGNMGFTL